MRELALRNWKHTHKPTHCDKRASVLFLSSRDREVVRQRGQSSRRCLQRFGQAIRSSSTSSTALRDRLRTCASSSNVLRSQAHSSAVSHPLAKLSRKMICSCESTHTTNLAANVFRRAWDREHRREFQPFAQQVHKLIIQRSGKSGDSWHWHSRYSK